MEAAAKPEEIFNVLKDLTIFSNGKLLTENKKVWQQACDLINEKIAERGTRIQRHNLYIIVQQNRHNLYDKLVKHHGIESHEQYIFFDNHTSVNDEDSVVHKHEYGDDDFTIGKFMDKKNPNPHKLKPLTFDIPFNEKEWTKLRPNYVTYADRRKYLVFDKESWTDLVVKKMWNERKLTCKYAIKNQRFFVSKDHPFFKFYGRCSVCKTYFEGICSRQYSVESESVNIIMNTYETGNIDKRLTAGNKGKKRKLKGECRKKLKKILKYAKGNVVRLMEGNELLNYSDSEPAFLQNSIKLRKARQEAIDEALQLNGPKDIFKSLVYLSANSWPEIREVTRYPFVVKYWTDEQLLIWRDLKSNGKWLSVSIDSSGSFVKEVHIDDDISGHVFLHVMVTVYENKIIPLWQMLSEKQDTNTIKLWLREAQSQEAPNPDEVKTDGCTALLNASCLAYNNCSFKEYLCASYEVLKHKRHTLKPCYVRMDRAHIMKSVSSWKCFKKQQSEVPKDYVMRSIGLAINVKSVNMLEDLLFTLLLTINSPLLVPNSECVLRMKWLENEFENYNMQPFSNEDFENSVRNVGFEDIENEDEKNELMLDNPIKDNVTSKYNYAVELINRESAESDIDCNLVEPNPYYFPAASDNIMYLFYQYPAWTAVLVDIYKSPNDAASSAASESHFKDLKNNNWLTYPVKANRFLPSNISLIKGRVKLSKSDLKAKENHEELVEKLNIDLQIIKKEKTTINSLDLQRDEKKIHEQTKSIINLREKVHDELHPAEKQRDINFYQSYTTKGQNKEIESKHVSKIHKNSAIFNGLIKNGLRLGRIVFDEQKPALRFINTCAFDSISEILVASSGNKYVKDLIQNGRCKYLEIINKFINNGFLLDELYKDRAKLLYPYSRIHKNEDYTRDCTINIIDLLNSLLQDNSSSLLQLKKVCSICGDFNIHSDQNTLFITYKYSASLFDKINGGLNKLQSCINNIFNDIYPVPCTVCNHIAKKKQLCILQNVLIIETEYMFFAGEITHTIQCDFPLTLTVSDKEYEVIGFIEIMRISDSVNHYVAYYYKNGIWECRDSLKNSVHFMEKIPVNLGISMIIYVQK